MIYPDFPTDIKFEIPEIAVAVEGDFYHTIFDHSLLEHEGDVYSHSIYSTYDYADRGYTKIRNSAAPLDTKILSLGDSFTNVVTPYFALLSSNCDELDMRHYQGIFLQYYNEFDPEIVITTISIFSDNFTYDFFPDI